MERKQGIDSFGAVALVGFSLVLGLGQVLIKLGNEGFGPVFFAAMRSVLSLAFLLAWMRLKGIPVELGRRTWPAGLLIGVIFSAEFIFLFLALDLTTVVRSALIFYTMPMWLSLMAHFLLPGERLTPVKGAGLVLAFSGVAMVLLSRDAGGAGSLAGDLCALAGALCWAGLAMTARATRLSEVRAESQLLWQLAVSSVVLSLAAPLFGPLLRGPEAVHWAILLGQALVVSCAAFLLWMWLLKIYPASSVASFGFLTPVFATLLGWLVLGETLSPLVIGALGAVALGLWLVNRPGGRVRTA